MSASLLEVQEQICYVQCGYCTTILLVNVPCSSLLKVVTVRCGHCTGLLSVNMMRASFIPLQLLASVDDNEKEEVHHEEPEHSKDPPAKELDNQSPISSESDEEEEIIPLNPIINKRKEEIQRLKAVHPNISHKEAFSTAAKNWAHFPRIQHQLDGESCSHGGRKVDKRPRC
ncbi:hypothetical protein IFM89_038766 [Coptis chinensis]|uniref:Axial regulator YABBY 4 n=1 Tax=Coptis chinensis TaxID=261450 RepID=A0A835IYY8_9MAGN|nr:hypothetical protein IFM89_038766 [Coptis chinensis]